MARKRWVGLSLVLIMAGCAIPNANGKSLVDDDAKVVVSGTLKKADGTPYAGQAIKLVKESIESQDVFGGRGRHEATSTDAGLYTFIVRGEHTKNSFGQASNFWLDVTQPDGQAVKRMFVVNGAEINVPTLRFWDDVTAPAPGAVQGETLEVRWNPPTGEVKEPKLSLRQDNDVVLWEAALTQPPYLLPKYVLDDDRSYRLQVSHKAGGSEFLSAHRAFKSAPDATAKVLAIVAATDDRGRELPQHTNQAKAFQVLAASPKPTATMAPSPSPRPHTALSVTLDLGATKAVGHVVGTWNLSGEPLVVTTSTDGTTWGQSLGRTESRCFDLDLKATQARYVKLTSPNKEIDFSRLQRLRLVGP